MICPFYLSAVSQRLPNPVGICFFIFSGLLFLILHVFSQYSYEFSSEALQIQCKIFGGITFYTTEIPFQNIEGVRLSAEWQDVVGAKVRGNLSVQPAALIFLKKAFFKRVFVTPKEPDTFVEKLKTAVGLAS